jgi:mono/diheme cytochrome c family protein
MSTPCYEADLIARENDDPVESSSFRFVNIPLVMISCFLGFGISYLLLSTPSIDFTVGDSRSTEPVESVAVVESEETALQLGEQLYKKNCQACHQAGGGGLGTTFPPLDGSEWVQGDPERLTAIVLHGISGEITVKGQTYRGVMPPFKAQLEQHEVAAVTSYLRSSWSNQASAVDVALVSRVATATADRKGPWKGEQELNQIWE